MGRLSHGWRVGRRCGCFPLRSLDRSARLVQRLLTSSFFCGGRLRAAALLLGIHCRNSVERSTRSCSELFLAELRRCPG